MQRKVILREQELWDFRRTFVEIKNTITFKENRIERSGRVHLLGALITNKVDEKRI